jgi:hypothetical protein
MTTTFDFQNLTEKEIAVLLDTVLEVINNPDTPVSTLETIIETALAKNIVEPIKSKILQAVDVVMQKRNSVEIITFDFGDGNGAVPAHRHKNPDGSLGGWVANTATVKKTVRIEIGAVIFGNAAILDHARIYDNAQVFGNAKVTDNARVGGKAKVYDKARICNDVHIYGMAEIYGNARIFGILATNQKTNKTAGIKVKNTIVSGLPQQPTGFKIPPPPEPLQFNTERISEIKTESKKLSAMLNTIYEQDNLPPEAPKINNSSVLNLDDTHLDIVKILATRPEWERDELQTIMNGMMIDGVLEHINDAFFDYYNEPFIEGYDPIEINVKLFNENFLEKMK